ncbi:hypothetical protein UlMin_031415 [Ulmus minor]
MSTSIFQGLQSCLEPGLVEPRVPRLRFAPPKSDLTGSSKEKSQQNEIESNTNKNGWSCLHALAKKDVVEAGKIYVHPLVKRASSMLSAKSLEMCTESLGSETGNDASQGGEDDVVSEDSGKFPTRESSKVCKNRKELKNLNRSSSFPPPLTSVSGSGGLQVRPHREDGRLVLKAVVVPSCNTYFHAERSDGRLTLRLMRDVPPNSDIDNEEEDEEELEEELVEEDDTCLKAEKQEGVEEDDTCLEAIKEEEEEEEEVEEDEAEIEEEGEEETEEMSLEMEKLRRISRCKDGHRGSRVIIKWEPFWVAT